MKRSVYFSIVILLAAMVYIGGSQSQAQNKGAKKPDAPIVEISDKAAQALGQARSNAELKAYALRAAQAEYNEAQIYLSVVIEQARREADIDTEKYELKQVGQRLAWVSKDVKGEPPGKE